MNVRTSAEIRKVLCQRGAVQGVPVSGIFELTPRCNLRCKMCYVRLTPEQMAPIGQELTASQWLMLAKEAKDQGLIFLLLTGGEPTLRTDFPEIYENLATMGFSISINTNGTLLTPELKQLWHQLPPAQVNVTLYGACREDYEALCGDGSAFDRVCDCLDWLAQEGILIHLNTTITPENQGSLVAIEEFARNRGLELRLTAYCFPPARRSECNTCPSFHRLEPETAARLMIQDHLYQEGPELLKLRASRLNTPPQAECDLNVGDAMSCMAGRAQFWMSWNGVMSPCGMFTQPQALPLEQGFCTAWESLRHQVDAIRLCPECATCPDKATCMNCAAVTYTETGSFSGTPDYMCRLNRSYRQQLIETAATLNENGPEEA